MFESVKIPKLLTKKVEKIVDSFRSPEVPESAYVYKFSAKVYTGNNYTQNPIGMCGEAYYCRKIKSDEPLEQDELEEILVQFVAELKERYRLQTVCPLGYWNANKDFERIIYLVLCFFVNFRSIQQGAIFTKALSGFRKK